MKFIIITLSSVTAVCFEDKNLKDDGVPLLNKNGSMNGSSVINN